MKILKKIFYLLRWIYWSRKFGQYQSRFKIDSHVFFQNPKSLFFGRNIGIGDYTSLLPCIKYAGKNYTPKIIIGDGTWVGKHCSIAAINKVEIGKNVLFAGYVHITDHSHGYEDVNTPIKEQCLISKGPIVIDDECWLGFNCEILSGVHIGKHSIVAARAVVTHDVPPYSIVAGNPAKVVKQYDFQNQIWVKAKN